MEWLERIKSGLGDRKTVQTRAWDENGVHAVEGEESIAIGWSDVRRVYAYKKDCLTVDQLRLMIMGDQDAIEFTEDDYGFDHLCALLSERLGVSDGWHTRLVTSLAFETTLTSVYPGPAANEVIARRDDPGFR
jgi:hypothetical protein